MERRRRIGAYGLCRDADRVLLARADDVPGGWQVPGGGLDHGEDPDHAVERTLAEQTGLAVRIVRPVTAVSDVCALPELDVEWHVDRIVYEVEAVGGERRDGTAWVAREQLDGLRLTPFTALLLDRPVTPLDGAALAGPALAGPAPRPDAVRPPVPADRGQRFAAYAVATDPAGRILLTRIAPGFPGAGRWHLPGGGTDFAEQPAGGVLRELREETGQAGRIVALHAVGHSHNPRALGPEGYPIDWHAVRVVFRVAVDLPTEPYVTEAEGGSTVEARWFTWADARRLTLTQPAARALDEPCPH